jgi:hypothetical protein
MWILVLRPSRERPIVCVPFFGRTSGMLVRTQVGAIQKHLFKIRVFRQPCKYLLPNPSVRPAREARVHAIPRPEFCEQIAPRAAGARNPQH